jgi:type III secretion protein R
MDFSTFSPALVLVTVVSLALAPFVAVMVTSFTKIVVVLSLLRNALGLQQVPPNVVINGLAIVLSIYVMYPVLLDTHAAINARIEGKPVPASIQAQIDARTQARARAAATAPPSATTAPPGATDRTAIDSAAVESPASPAATDALRAEAEAQRRQTPAPAPGQAPAEPAAAPREAAPAAQAPPPPPLPKDGKMDTERLLALAEAGKEPLRTFLIRHSSNTERGFFLRSAQRLLPPARRAELSVDDFIVVVPAFTVSELTAAFQIGFLIFLPFLIIDLVVANILLALGMMMMSPTTVSLPFKLLLFVLIDGWAKLVHGLVMTYGG